MRTGFLVEEHPLTDRKTTVLVLYYRTWYIRYVQLLMKKSTELR
jgi:hypothetical protein